MLLVVWAVDFMGCEIDSLYYAKSIDRLKQEGLVVEEIIEKEGNGNGEV